MSKVEEELLTPEYANKLNALCDNDRTLSELFKKREYNIKRGRAAYVAKLDYDIEARREELAGMILSEFFNDRDKRRAVVNDLPEEKRELYLAMRNAASFCCDTLETILMDMNSMFKGTDITYDYTPPKCLAETKETLHKWIKDDMSSFTLETEELYCTEADNAAKFLIGRGRILNNKIKRIEKKQTAAE